MRLRTSIHAPLPTGAASKVEKDVLKLQGLLESLSEFHVQSHMSLDLPEVEKRHSLLCVAENLLTGRTRVPAVDHWVKKRFAPVTDDPAEKDVKRAFWESLGYALILYEPEAHGQGKEIFNTDVFDSNFETFAFFDLMSGDVEHLRQAFCPQMPLRDFELPGGIGKEGRVDFGYVNPLWAKREGLVNRYNKPLPPDLAVRSQSVFVLEIDGARYHNWYVDNQRDHVFAEIGTSVSRIRENTREKDWDRFREDIIQDEYISALRHVSVNPVDESIRQEVLGPIAQARIQIALLRYLICLPSEDPLPETLRVCVLERDVACGEGAIRDLNELFHHLGAIAGESMPHLEVEVIRSRSFESASDILQAGSAKPHDLLIDSSILRKSGVFHHDALPVAEREIRIRSEHYALDAKPLLTAPLVEYLPPMTHTSENQDSYIKNEDLIPHYEYFLNRCFGHTRFREGQLEILSRAVQLKSVIGLLPTGGGKSLTYQLAALLQPGLTLVVDPIRALMKDQHDSLRSQGYSRIEYVNSTRSAGASRAALDKLKSGEIQLLFISPERFMIPLFRNSIRACKAGGFHFAYVVIDEAHCVSEWGHDFRTTYLDLGRTAQNLCATDREDRVVPLFGLTATASFDVLADIERELQIRKDDGNVVVRFENTIRNEIQYQVLAVGGVHRNEVAMSKRGVVAAQLDGVHNAFQPFLDDDRTLAMLSQSWSDYVPDHIKEEFRSEIEPHDALEQGEDIARKSYIEQGLRKLALSDHHLEYGRGDGFSALVFCPHKTGDYGVSTFHAELSSYHETGYFHGGDNEQVMRPDQDKETLKMLDNLEKFKAGEQDVMVATKAFGMGIDKANIRYTVHVNIPGSIESFVQESGRAGRDGRLAVSTMLFSEDSDEDRDVLEFFFNNSFKGELKERVMIYELRNRIWHPRVSMLKHELLRYRALRLQEPFVRVNFGRNRHENTLFFNGEAGQGQGRWNLPDDPDGERVSRSCKPLVNWILERYEERGVDLAHRLKESTQSIQMEGIEHIWNSLSEGDFQWVPIPFENALVPKTDGTRKTYPAHEHVDYLLHALEKMEGFREVPDLRRVLDETLTNVFTNDRGFDEFKDKLREVCGVALPDDDSSIQDLHQRFLAPRMHSDTAKALHRFMQIGIVTEYMIDYQNKVYYVRVEKHPAEHYFNNVRDFINRYASSQYAEQEVQKAKQQFSARLAENVPVSMFSVLFELVTAFIYHKIADKRRRAMDDMVELCRSSLEIDDPFEQSQYIKDRIYYYFNAKYSRAGNVAIVDGSEVNASLQDDMEELSVRACFEKYSKLAEADQTDAFRTNLKHLRGACGRLSRSTTGHPEYALLNGCSRLILNQDSQTVRNDASQELTHGMLEWTQLEPDIELDAAFQMIETWLNEHVSPELVEDLLSQVRPLVEVKHTNRWLSSFNQRLLAS